MVISDDALAQTYLNRIGYYRLSGYWFPYRQSSGAGASRIVQDNFRSGTKFSEVVELYVFDKKLRLLMLDVIERIEIALRVQITLELGKLGPLAHRDPAALHPNFQRPAAPGSAESHHSKWLRLHDEAFARSKEEFAKHFKRKYPGEDPPIWIAAELWDFGSMSVLYSGMRKNCQTDVAKLFGVPSFQIMETWLRALNVTRNICAHHSRLWNKPNAVPPRWPSPSDCPDLGHVATDTHAKTRLYGMACICAFLLRTINPNSTWVSRFKAHAATFPNSTVVNIASAGFPVDWDKANLWT
ncbi:Abi family protein [Bradyrhizobium sp. SZCCHNS2015]|uniref:Abi family protein n=1 Tax=Bradyrhizobium sp. SZCCHNS2015 TaxID=3057305 RepID=UPI0028E77A29|nr:Abi family protein [Bradyrhizobium sp. SZCCHNS2015]